MARKRRQPTLARALSDLLETISAEEDVDPLELEQVLAGNSNWEMVLHTLARRHPEAPDLLERIARRHRRMEMRSFALRSLAQLQYQGDLSDDQGEVFVDLLAHPELGDIAVQGLSECWPAVTWPALGSILAHIGQRSDLVELVGEMVKDRLDGRRPEDRKDDEDVVRAIAGLVGALPDHPFWAARELKEIPLLPSEIDAVATALPAAFERGRSLTDLISLVQAKRVPGQQDWLLKLAGEKDREVAEGAGAALRALGHEPDEDEKGLLRALGHKVPFTREAAAEALAARGAVDELVVRLGRTRKAVRLAALHGLEHVRPRSSEIVGHLVGALDDEKAEVRFQAARALARWLTEEKLKVAKAQVRRLIQTLEDPDLYVRGHVCTALGAVGSTSAVHALIRRTKDDDLWVRRNAIQALGEIGDRRAVPRLQEIMEELMSFSGCLTVQTDYFGAAERALKAFEA